MGKSNEKEKDKTPAILKSIIHPSKLRQWPALALRHASRFTLFMSISQVIKHPHFIQILSSSARAIRGRAVWPVDGEGADAARFLGVGGFADGKKRTLIHLGEVAQKASTELWLFALETCGRRRRSATVKFHSYHNISKTHA